MADDPRTNGSPDPGFRLAADGWGKLVLTDDAGRVFVGVDPVRAFPITAPRQAIALRDAEGREIRWIDDLAALPAAMRELLEAELSRRQFLPVLTRIVRISGSEEPTVWEVETDRGRTTFLLASDENVWRLPGRRALVVDGNGLRYLIPDITALDTASRRWLDRYL